MAVRIRMTRRGRKKKPFFRIVATDKQSPRDGKFLDILGTVDNLRNPPVVTLKRDKILEWLNKGATPSQTVMQLFQREGLWKEFHAEAPAAAAAAESAAGN